MTDIKWIELIVTDHITANIYKGILESNDIPVLFRSNATYSVHPFTVGNVQVMVPDNMFSLAQALTEDAVIIQDPDQEI